MISLQVEDYCQKCDGFEPKVIRMFGESFFGAEDCEETVIKCESAKKCANMYKHIQKEVEKENARVYKCE